MWVSLVPQWRAVVGVKKRGQVSTLDFRDGKSVSGQLDGRLEESGPRQLPVQPVRLLVAPDLTWDRNPLAAWVDGEVSLLNLCT